MVSRFSYQFGKPELILYTDDMKLLFAQGNPGSDYENTRHNVGFFVLDTFAQTHSVTFQLKDKFRALIAETEMDGEKVLLAKPTTFYNQTGQSARAIVDFYKLDPAQDVLVIHDELALPFGTLRTREQGSDAGNNGIKSINAHLGPQTKRIRIGIHNELADRIDAADFVLSRFTPAEKKQLQESVLPHIEQHIHKFLAGTFEPTKIKTISSLETPEDK